MMYASSKGPVDIATMPLRYATNALGKLRRDEPSRVAEIAALEAHIAAGGFVGDGVEPNERAVIGGNSPPDPTPFDDARELLSNLDVEASAWFDGHGITNDAQADEVSRLIDDGRKASNRFDGARKAEKQPHTDAGKAVDERWKPLITDANRIVEVAKGVLTPWLIAKDVEKRAAEAEAKRAADEAAEAARKATAEADGSLAAAKARDEAIEQAQQAQREAERAAAAKPQAKGCDMARAVTLRTTWRSEVTDRRALLNHVAKVAPDDLDAFLRDWSAREVRTGRRDLPGVSVWEEKAAA